jgi:ElaB protein
VETTGNDLDRAAARAARHVTREARAEVNKQVDQLLTDVLALVNRLRDVADAEVAFLRDRIENAVAAVKAALADRAQQALDRGDRYVHAQPWQVVGIAATTGMLIGLFLGRRSRRLARAGETVRVASNARPC